MVAIRCTTCDVPLTDCEADCGTCPSCGSRPRPVVDEMSPRPWYGTSWGIVYLSLLGMAATTILWIAAAVPQRSGVARELALLISVGVLDVLLPIPIAVAIFRHRFWRLAGAPFANVAIGLFLLAPCLYVVWCLVFVVWMFLATIF